MDNVTHTLIGAAVARVLPDRFRRPEIYWASVLANNAPDSDFLIRFLPGSTSFDSLIHHRGYTHTFLAAPAFGILSAAVAKRIARAPRWSPELFAVGILGCFLHIGADFLNNYGVHPLTPFVNRWFYGDTIYIVEPLVWFALLPFVAREAERGWARATWILLALSMLGLVWLFPTFTTGLSTALTVLFVAATLATYRTRGAAARRLVPIGLLAFVLGAFAVAGARARTVVREAWRSANVAAEVEIDVGTSPGPGNPFCWSAWLATKTPTEYRMRAADVSLWPAFYSAMECGAFSRANRTAKIDGPSLNSSAEIRWNGDAVLPIAEFSAMRAKSPRFRRLLAFARFPFVRSYPDGTAIAGDLRYDREPGVGFAEVAIPADEANENGPADEATRGGPWDPPFKR